MIFNPSKKQAIKAAIDLTPQYAEYLKELQNTKGQSFFKKEVVNIQNNYGDYVLMYDDERKISRAFMFAALGEDGVKELELELENSTPQEQQQWIESISDEHEIVQAYSSINFPETPDQIQQAKDEFEKLSEDERKQSLKQAAFFWCFTFSTFFNTLSLMVHGSKLTSLVPQAIAGDDLSFLKAVQIDRMLLLHYPYFRERKFRAQDEGDIELLTKINYRESNLLRSKIRYPALYMLFGILDTYMWLDELKHSEILDICDQAQLDRFQNRIEDENCITKRLLEYRRWQKTGGVSMH
jgi:hypothetical protein